MKDYVTDTEQELAEARKYIDQLWDEHSALLDEAKQLRSINQALVAETSMLRKELTKVDNHRVRLQGMCSSLSGRLQAIKAVIEDAVRDAIKNGVEAEQRKPTFEMPMGCELIRPLQETATSS